MHAALNHLKTKTLSVFSKPVDFDVDGAETK